MEIEDIHDDIEKYEDNSNGQDEFVELLWVTRTDIQVAIYVAWNYVTIRQNYWNSRMHDPSQEEKSNQQL